MLVGELVDLPGLTLVNSGAEPQRSIESAFCCDLLSLVMSRAPAGCAWVTVMGNVNSVAVAVLADIACVVLAEGAAFDDTALKRAEEKGVALFKTDLPVFEAALSIHSMLGNRDD
ncbi:MAG: DRTGG domain-containing protein [Clostridiales bacterium]|nr:DRTGG domain-containing protein [Clostridiales bacterium]